MSHRKLLSVVDQHLKNKQDRKLISLLVKKDFHVIARVIDHLKTGQIKVFGLLPPEIQAEVALVLNDTTKQYIFPHLSEFSLARMLHFNDEDDAVDILQYLPHKKRTDIIYKLKEDKRQKVEKLLKYHPESAGGIMDMNFILVKPEYSLKDVAGKVQLHSDRTKQAPLVISADEQAKILGYIPYKNLIFRPAISTVKSLTQPLPVISYEADQEEVLDFLLREKGEVIGVIDQNEHVLGVIHARDLIRIVQDEATEDVYQFAGVSLDESTFGSIQTSVQRRYKWLLLNLGTALIASFVISYFKNTIASMAILAAYMPVVAGLGGNTGTQSLAVVVRGIALGEVSWENGKRVVVKEMITGMCVGIIVGVVGSIMATLLNQNPLLGFVLGTALIINLTMAGFVGGLTPLILKRFGADPAIASSVFVTGSIDIFGFAIFLGLATLILL